MCPVLSLGKRGREGSTLRPWDSRRAIGHGREQGAAKSPHTQLGRSSRKQAKCMGPQTERAGSVRLWDGSDSFPIPVSHQDIEGTTK